MRLNNVARTDSFREKEISEALALRITAWRHTGFSVHNGVKVRDAAGRQKLAQYMLRTPFSLEKIRYDWT